MERKKDEMIKHCSKLAKQEIQEEIKDIENNIYEKMI